jgi:hypothetical protein
VSTTTHVEGNGARGGGKSLLSGTRVLIISLAVVALLVAMTAAASAERGTGNEIVGTWVVDVAESDGGVPGFQSLLTFHEGGTLTEVSSELGLGLQGLGHGGWTRQGQDYAATFQVWLFNPDTGVAEGRIQVRAAIRIDKDNQMTADTAIDFIDPGGNVIPDIDSGPFEATVLEVVGP